MKLNKLWIGNYKGAPAPVIYNIGETEAEAAKVLTLGPIARNENRVLSGKIVVFEELASVLAEISAETDWEGRVRNVRAELERIKARINHEHAYETRWDKAARLEAEAKAAAETETESSGEGE